MRIGINGRSLGPNKTGVGRYLSSLLSVWAKEATQHEFFVYYTDNNLLPEDEAIFSDASHMHLKKLSFPSYPLSFHFWYTFSFPKAIKKDNIDFFFSPDYFLPPLLGKIKRSIAIHDVSYLAHPEWYSTQDRANYNFYSKMQAKKATIIFTISEYSKKEILYYIPLRQKKIHVVPLAADKKFQLQKKIVANMIKYGINNKYFLYVGMIFNRRNVPKMLEAFYQYVCTNNDNQVQFVLRGENGTHPFVDIKKIIFEINSKLDRNAIITLPHISDDELIILYQNASAFFYLSDYEGFGLPVLEALSCGTLTVTTRMSSIPEVAGDAAIYVNPSNIMQQSTVMRDILSNKIPVQKIKAKSIMQAKKFSWHHTAKTTLSIIENSMFNKN